MANAAADQHIDVAISFLEEARAEAERVKDIESYMARVAHGIGLLSQNGRLHLAEVELAKA